MTVLTVLVVGWCGLSVPLSVAVARLMRADAGRLGGTVAGPASNGSSGRAA